MAGIAGTSAPVKKTIFEPERIDNPFIPALPEPRPVFVPEWLDPNHKPVRLPEWLDPNREPVPVRVRR